MLYHVHVDDAALVAGAIGGNQEAFGSIYDRYGGRIHDFLCSLLRDRDDAADVLHDTFLVAGARLHQLRDPTRLRPWLYAIARHEGLRRIKARSRQEPLGDTEVTATGAGPADVAAQGELVELVAAAALGLSPRDRVVLDLHLRQGLDGQELGEAMGVSASHAYVLLSRLRDQVERSLGALLVTRLGRDDCTGLQAILAGWDGRFSPLVRKRVARHVDGCEPCSDVRSRAFSPLALLAAVPPIALPAELRDRVLGDVALVSHQGRPWPGRRGGFPPPMDDGRPRRRVLVGAAAAVLLLVGGSAITSRPAPPTAPVVEVDAGTNSTSTSAPGDIGGGRASTSAPPAEMPDQSSPPAADQPGGGAASTVPFGRPRPGTAGDGAGGIPGGPDGGLSDGDIAEPVPGTSPPDTRIPDGDSGGPDSTLPDPGRPDPGRPDPGRPDPGRPDPGRPDPGGDGGSGPSTPTTTSPPRRDLPLQAPTGGTTVPSR